MMKIKDWSADERPREKMLERGPKALSNAELLAILIRTGTAGKNAVDVARELLRNADGSLTAASSMTVNGLCRIDGVGKSKALCVMAALELGKRMCSEMPDSSPRIIRSSEDVYKEMVSELRGLKHEECWILFLARNNKVIAKERVSSGGHSETVVDIKLVVRRALEIIASGVIIIHNHPSGDPRPGKADIEMTKNLKKALTTFDIHLIDHLIFSDGCYYSFSDEYVGTIDTTRTTDTT